MSKRSRPISITPSASAIRGRSKNRVLRRGRTKRLYPCRGYRLDPNSWKILKEHGHAVHALLLRLTLRRDVADDLLHDLFVKLAGRIARTDNPRGYMHRTAINLAMDWRRRHGRQPHVADVSDQPAETREPRMALEASEEIEQILDAAAVLSELEHQAFVLRFVQQESYEQIGLHLQRTPHQARGVCDAAIKHLRKELGKRQADYERTKRP
jgi:RNA polymerase sigma factor (sigma-70 family)